MDTFCSLLPRLDRLFRIMHRILFALGRLLQALGLSLAGLGNGLLVHSKLVRLDAMCASLGCLVAYLVGLLVDLFRVLLRVLHPRLQRLVLLLKLRHGLLALLDVPCLAGGAAASLPRGRPALGVVGVAVLADAALLTAGHVLGQLGRRHGAAVREHGPALAVGPESRGLVDALDLLLHLQVLAQLGLRGLLGGLCLVLRVGHNALLLVFGAPDGPPLRRGRGQGGLRLPHLPQGLLRRLHGELGGLLRLQSRGPRLQGPLLRRHDLALGLRHVALHAPAWRLALAVEARLDDASAAHTAAARARVGGSPALFERPDALLLVLVLVLLLLRHLQGGDICGVQATLRRQAHSEHGGTGEDCNKRPPKAEGSRPHLPASEHHRSLLGKLWVRLH
mmetsp:Transcript_107687/g.314860  ORF Transcript_107687/g.314860 Transcript_107687/m.314860 type:complete len:392 (+) Transcript_107687:270-1445(+)